MFVPVISHVSGQLTQRHHFDFATLCRLSFCCATLRDMFHRMIYVAIDDPVRVYAGVIASRLEMTLPRGLRRITFCCETDFCYFVPVLDWWLPRLLFTPILQLCIIACGSVSMRQWRILCNRLDRLGQRRGELRVPLHISVIQFWIPPHEAAPWVLWIAQSASLVLRLSSHVSISTPSLNIDSEWVRMISGRS